MDINPWGSDAVDRAFRLDRWLNNLAALGVGDRWRSEAVATFRALDRAYRQPWRFYHDRRHITICLLWLDAWRSQADDPAAIEFALWLHDAAYVPQRSDNEARSAVWARALLARWGVAAVRRDWVAAAILATRHADREPPDGDTALLLDIDLAILAAPVGVFDRYRAEIRREYGFVAAEAFRAGREKLVRGWLGRDRLFESAIGFAGLEARARWNLAREVGMLGG